ncbi:MAG: creatininase family protein [Anaerolineales bacterium]|jgi:creatinine amidohydrolase
MRFADLNWFDVERYLEEDDRLMLVLGSCEQHGYLSLLTDVKIPLALADAASKDSGVLVAPAISFGVSPYFTAYPGTLSLRISTLINVVEDVLRSCYRQGFRRVLVLNGHGGNDAVRGRIYEILEELNGLRVAWYAWWQSAGVEAFLQERRLKTYHAGWIEAYPFTRVADLPVGEKKPPFVPALLGPVEARKIYKDGVFGGPYQLDDSILDKVFRICLEDVLQLLQFVEGESTN